MKEGDVAGGIFCLVLLFVFFKFFMIVGGLVALAAISYFGTEAYEDSDNRIRLLKKRVAPSIIIMFLCFGIASSLPNHHKMMMTKMKTKKLIAILTRMVTILMTSQITLILRPIVKRFLKILTTRTTILAPLQMLITVMLAVTIIMVI